MKLFGYWLLLVGTLRLASVWSVSSTFGPFVSLFSHKLTLYVNLVVTDIHGRTFGVWTLLTCTLCALCTFNLENKPLYLATLLSFVYALGHFMTEFLIYRTMAIGNLTTVGIVAGTSIIWMLLQWNSHKPIKSKSM